MNEDQKNALRTDVLGGDDDFEIQLEWFNRSLKEHLKLEQECKARFRLCDFCGDEMGMQECQKRIEEIRSAITFLQREIFRPKLKVASGVVQPGPLPSADRMKA